MAKTPEELAEEARRNRERLAAQEAAGVELTETEFQPDPFGKFGEGEVVTTTREVSGRDLGLGAITPEQMAEADWAAQQSGRTPGESVYGDLDEEQQKDVRERKARIRQQLAGMVSESVGPGVLGVEEGRAAVFGQPGTDDDQLDMMVEAVSAAPGGLSRTDENGDEWVMVNNRATRQSGWVRAERAKANPQTYSRIDKNESEKLQFLENRLGTLSREGRQALATAMTSGKVTLATWGNIATGGLLMDLADNESARLQLQLAQEANPTATTIGGIGGAVGMFTGDPAGMLLKGAARGAKLAAGALGAQRHLSQVKSAAGYLRARAVASGSSLAERSTAIQAMGKLGAATAGKTPLTTPGTLFTLAADGAAGEVLAARADAALADVDLTSDQMLAAAQNGLVWGLGFGVGGAMVKGGYRLNKARIRKKNATAAGRNLNKVETAVPEAAFKDRDDFMRHLAGAEGQEGKAKAMEWLQGNREHLPPESQRLVDQYTEAGGDTFASNLKLSNTPGNRAKARETLNDLKQLDDEIADLGVSAPRADGQAVVMSQIEEAAAGKIKAGSRQNFATGKAIEDAAPALKDPANAEVAFNRAKASVLDVIDEIEALGASSASPAWFRETGEAAAKSTKRVSARAQPRSVSAVIGDLRKIADGKDFKEPKRFDGSGATRALGNSFLGMNKAGEVLHAAAQSLPAGPAKTSLQDFVGQLRAEQLGREGAAGAFGDFGVREAGKQASLEGIQGARVELFGLGGKSATAGPLGEGGEWVGDLVNDLELADGLGWGEATDAVETYVKAVERFVAGSDEAIQKRLGPAVAKLRAGVDRMAPQWRTRGAAAELFESATMNTEDGVFIPAKNVVTPPVPPAAEKTLRESIGEEAQSWLGRSATDFVINSLPPYIAEPIRVARHIASKVSTKADVVESVEEFEKRMSAKEKKLEKAFKRQAPLVSPGVRVGAMITRGQGAPSTDELDRMNTVALRETFDAIRDDIQGLIDSPALAAGIAGQSTEPLVELSPGLSQAIQNKMAGALYYLAGEMPKGVVDPLNPGKPGPVSVGEMQSFMRQYRAINDPLSLLDDLAEGKLRTEAAGAVQKVYPDLFAQIALSVAQQMIGNDISFADRNQIGQLLGIPGSNLMTGSALLAFQQNYAGAQTPEQAQALGLQNRRRTEAIAAAARMPAATRSSAGRFMTTSEHLEGPA